MSKLKQGGEIPGTSLRRQIIRCKEIAPVYHKRWDESLIAAETEAMIQASNAGYRAVCIQDHGDRPRQASVYVLVEGVWTKADYALGKWGKLSAADPGGIWKGTPAATPLALPAPASPLAGVTARIEAVSPLWPEVDSPEINTMAKRLIELANLEPAGLTVPYSLDTAGI